MFKKTTLFILAVTAIFAAATAVSARDSDGDGYGRRGRSGKRFSYDLSKEQQVSGTVESVRISENRRRSQNRSYSNRPLRKRVVATVTVNGTRMRMSAGPEGWLTGKGISLQKGTQFQAKGIVIQTRRGKILIVREITVNNTTAALRDSTGRPAYRSKRGNSPAKNDGTSKNTDSGNNADSGDNDMNGYDD